MSKIEPRPSSTPDIWTIARLLHWSSDYLGARQIDSPRTTAEVLLAHALGRKRIELYTHFDKPLETDELQRFKGLIKRRTAREPLAYITGVKEFWSYELAITQDVLIPRPETESLVEQTLATLDHSYKNRPLRVLDLGTGCGAIVVALACQRPQHIYVATDIDEAALATARRNVHQCPAGANVQFVCSDWLAGFRPAAGFDLIVSNPPYIRSTEIVHLQPEIHRYEPQHALDGGRDGLDAYRTIIDQAPSRLAPGGQLLFEIGFDQAVLVRKIAERQKHFSQMTVYPDYRGKDRILKLEGE